MKKKAIKIGLCYLIFILFYPANIAKAEEINPDEVVNVFYCDNTHLNITQSDIDLLAKLVYAESRGEPFNGKVAVASVVLNRALNPSFPSSIKGVIYQPRAFSCVHNNTINASANSECYLAVKDAILGKDPTDKALFFYNPEITTCSWMKNTKKLNLKPIGHHMFFRC